MVLWRSPWSRRCLLSTPFHPSVRARLRPCVCACAQRVHAYLYAPACAYVCCQVDRFVRVGQLDDDQAARMIQSLSLHLLVDLNGHTRGGRPRLLALQLAPSIVQFQGFADTMGMESVKYMMADRNVAPPEHQGLFQERLVYVDKCYHFYSARRNRFQNDGLPVRAEGGGGGGRAEEAEESNGHPRALDRGTDAAASGDADGRVNGWTGVLMLDAQVNTDRIEGHMWKIWLRVLSANNRTALRLRQGQNTRKEHDLLVNTLGTSAERAGVSRERLHFLRKVKKSEHLERMSARSDLLLDTDSYSAHSTALEALWAGVPVLTFPRQTFASRPPSSFLSALSMTQLVARTQEEYEAMALRLVSRPRVLKAWRRRLWQQRLEPTGLFDETGMLRSMRTALKMLWELALHLDANSSMHVVVGGYRSPSA